MHSKYSPERPCQQIEFRQKSVGLYLICRQRKGHMDRFAATDDGEHRRNRIRPDCKSFEISCVLKLFAIFLHAALAHKYLYRWQYDFQRLIRGVDDKNSSRELIKKFQKALHGHPEIVAAHGATVQRRWGKYVGGVIPIEPAKTGT